MQIQLSFTKHKVAGNLVNPKNNITHNTVKCHPQNMCLG